jgi:tRNA pseudouridine38-40 synthase
MRLALGIEYDGGDFFGWQKLGHGPSVQAVVESALGFVADATIVVQCAGRTDSGVHARCQVAHFDTDAQRSPRGWVLGANSRLPESVAVRWAQLVAEDFSARYSARARRYRYRILDRNIRPALLRRYVAWERLPLDADAMHRAAQGLIGEHDFSAFRAVQCQANHAVRDMQEIHVRREGEEIVIDVRANAFLHHMVRNIVGSLLAIGRGERPEAWMDELLHGRDRTVAGATAPPQGLCFLGPLYPAEWGLPAEATL